MKVFEKMGSSDSAVAYRLIQSGEETAVVDFVSDVFDEFVAPQYAADGIAEFRKFIRADTLADRLKDGNLVILAVSGQKIIGVIEIHKNSHVTLLFVEKFSQRKGIGRTLLERAIEICRQRKPDIQSITVNSSPNALAAYQKIGFKELAGEKAVNGIRFIPMALILRNKDDRPPVSTPAR